MGDRILVTYASRRGSTRDVADEIADTLTKAGITVDVLAIKDVTDLTPYRGAIIGSGVRRSGFLPEAVAFVRRNAADLTRIPVAYFAVCGLLKRDTPRTRKAASHFTDRPLKAAPSVIPVARASFAGRYEAPAMCPFMRLITRWGLFPSGDWRDWTAIRSWAEGLLPAITRHP